MKAHVASANIARSHTNAPLQSLHWLMWCWCVFIFVWIRSPTSNDSHACARQLLVYSWCMQICWIPFNNKREAAILPFDEFWLHGAYWWPEAETIILIQQQWCKQKMPTSEKRSIKTWLIFFPRETCVQFVSLIVEWLHSIETNFYWSAERSS